VIKEEINREISLRSAEISDEAFLENVYADSRRDELAIFGWSREQEDAFFKMQFEMQKQAYRIQFPDADYYIVKLGKTPIGRLIVYRAETEIRLVDIALLTEFRNHGIAGVLLERLKAEATVDKPLNLRVLKTNDAAKRFYERTGFTIVEDSDLHFSMQWRKF
jgi:ribosomal protein S18 acetylase RimI-like enzyme